MAHLNEVNMFVWRVKYKGTFCVTSLSNNHDIDLNKELGLPRDNLKRHFVLITRSMMVSEAVEEKAILSPYNFPL